MSNSHNPMRALAERLLYQLERICEETTAVNSRHTATKMPGFWRLNECWEAIDHAKGYLAIADILEKK